MNDWSQLKIVKILDLIQSAFVILSVNLRPYPSKDSSNRVFSEYPYINGYLKMEYWENSGSIRGGSNMILF